MLLKNISLILIINKSDDKLCNISYVTPDKDIKSYNNSYKLLSWSWALS